jgi:glycosyltransferase involved in cell wall biosynthesis
MLRVLVAHNVSRKPTGGMSRIMTFLHDELQQKGHAIDYFCCEDVPQRFRGSAARIAFPLLVLRHAIQAARAGRPYDVINVHEPVGAAITRFKSFAGAPAVVVTTHALEKRAWEVELHELRLGRGGPSLKTRILFPCTSLWQSRMTLKHADHIFCTNTQDRSYLNKWLRIDENRITRIAPGANPLFAVSAEGRDYSRAKRLLFAGTWIKRKGVEDLVIAFRDLAHSYPDLGLIVLGGGVPAASILSDFPDELRHRVECVQTSSDVETAKVFAESDIYILPSLFEGTPLTLIEAMMSGLPIVTTATCGMLDTINHDQNGLLVPLRSPAQIKLALTHLLNDGGTRERLGRTALREARRHYSWTNMATPLLSVYQRLATLDDAASNPVVSGVRA